MILLIKRLINFILRIKRVRKNEICFELLLQIIKQMFYMLYLKKGQMLMQKIMMENLHCVLLLELEIKLNKKEANFTLY